MQINYAIRWIAIYPVDSAIQRLNNPGLVNINIEKEGGPKSASVLTRFTCFKGLVQTPYFKWAASNSNLG